MEGRPDPIPSGMHYQLVVCSGRAVGLAGMNKFLLALAGIGI